MSTCMEMGIAEFVYEQAGIPPTEEESQTLIRQRRGKIGRRNVQNEGSRKWTMGDIADLAIDEVGQGNI